MTNENYTDITILLDKSASMAGVEDKTVAGVNEFINGQRKVEGKCRITTVLFDCTANGLRYLHRAEPISEVQNLTREQYQANGPATAYYDALGQLINDTGTRLAGLPESERPGKVLFVVMTDGYENNSREFSRSQLVDKIATQEKTYDWDFIFLGASFDAVAEYGDMLQKSGRSANYSKEHTTEAFSQLCSNVTSYRGAKRSLKNDVNLSAGIEEC